MPELVIPQLSDLTIRIVDANTIVISTKTSLRHRVLTLPDLVSDLATLFSLIYEEGGAEESLDRRVAFLRLALITINQDSKEILVPNLTINTCLEYSKCRVTTLAKLKEVEGSNAIIIADKRQEFLNLDNESKYFENFSYIRFISYGSQSGVVTPFFQNTKICNLCLRFLFANANDSPDIHLMGGEDLRTTLISLSRTLQLKEDDCIEFNDNGDLRITPYAPYIGCKDCI